MLAHQIWEGLAVVETEKGLSYIDKSGKVVLEPECMFCFSFSEGLAVIVDQELRCGYIDKKGNTVIKPRFRVAYPFSQGLALVELEFEGRESFFGPLGYINKKGEYIWKPRK